MAKHYRHQDTEAQKGSLSIRYWN